MGRLLDKKYIIQETVKFVKKELSGAETGHDWFHIDRVWKLSTRIAETENVDLFIVELGALLHDIADSKFYDGNEEIGPQKAKEFLKSLEIENNIIEHIVNIIRNISFKSSNNEQKFNSMEFQVIQDADRLDAIGAIGIARAFNFGGYKNNEIYDPEIKPVIFMSKEEYKKSNTTTINHFYDKLLLLKDKMNTEAGKNMAKKRHDFMEKFLYEFYNEWNGEL